MSVIGQAFSFAPALIQLPVGAQVTFFASSRDVLHGYHVAGTNINVELIPGEIATWSYTFREPGEYRVSCNEYCGISHQNMVGTIQVLPAAEYAALQEQRPRRPPGDAAAGEPGARRRCTPRTAWPAAGDSQGSQASSRHSRVMPPTSTRPTVPEYLVDVLLYGLMGPILSRARPTTASCPPGASSPTSRSPPS